MKLSTRLTIAMVALVVLTAAAVGILIYRDIEAVTLPRALNRLQLETELLAVRMEAAVSSARTDVAGFRSAIGLNKIVQASLSSDGMADGVPLADWRARMASRFAAELAAKSNYSKFRIIGVANNQWEVVRVDRNGPSGAIRTVLDSGLQTKGDRDFFRETLSLPDGGIFVSPVDLNQDHGVIETPHVPTIRAATPIYTPDGHPFGIVIINVDLRPVFDQVRQGAQDPGGGIFLVNDQGDYLIHPDRAREFGFEFGRRERLQDDFPQLEAAVKSAQATASIVRDRQNERFGAAIASVSLAGATRVSLVVTAPFSSIVAAATAARDASLLAGSAAALCAVILAILLARSLATPLERMTAAIEGFGRGAPLPALPNGHGEIGVLARAFTCMASDVRDKTEALTREVEERRSITDTALDAFVQIDQAGIVVEWNPQAEATFGWPRQEAIGQLLGALIVPPAQRERHTLGLAHFLRTGEGTILGKRMELAALRRDGHEITVELTITALRRPDGYIFNGFIRDVTDRIAAELQLRQSQKMDAVGQLTGGVAHDFNNILTVITGTIEILEQGVADRPDLATIAGMIDEAATRGAELTRQLLAFARRQPLDPHETDVNRLVIETARLLKPTLGEHIEIESMLEDDAWSALVDRSQLSAAIVNLAVNARDAMPNGGKLTLETGNVVLDEAYAAGNSEVTAGAYVMIAVSDTGSGIAADIRDRVFEPFFTTKEVGRGTGLGLSMVYGFAKQSGGHIKIYSEEGHGTAVKLYLPRTTRQVARVAEPALVPLTPRGNETILVVEDDALVRGYVIAQLEGLGYTTLAAADGATALALVDKGVAFDLLFTDVIMPGGMNGRQLADAVRKRRPSLNVLYTSGYTENAIVHHGRLDAGVALLNKPYRKTDLARKIRDALGTRADVA
jgi:PAS domain S-box-containing protein